MNHYRRALLHWQECRLSLRPVWFPLLQGTHRGRHQETLALFRESGAPSSLDLEEADGPGNMPRKTQPLWLGTGPRLAARRGARLLPQLHRPLCLGFRRRAGKTMGVASGPGRGARQTLRGAHSRPACLLHCRIPTGLASFAAQKSQAIPQINSTNDWQQHTSVHDRPCCCFMPSCVSATQGTALPLQLTGHMQPLTQALGSWDEHIL